MLLGWVEMAPRDVVSLNKKKKFSLFFVWSQDVLKLFLHASKLRPLCPGVMNCPSSKVS